MQVIVITGSTRGIGYGLARSFLALGCQVFVSGRSAATVDKAVAELAAQAAADRLGGQPCDVTQPEQVQALWDAAQARFKRVDIWINNAGLGQMAEALWKLKPEVFKAVVETNLLGSLYGARVAIEGMLAQGFGALYNLEGFGSDGRTMTGLNLYGCTKFALRYLTDALTQEMRDTPLIIGALQPGMVATDMVTKPYADRQDEWRRLLPIFNLIAQRVEVVAPRLARQILANRKSGARLHGVTPLEIAGHFLLAPFYKRNVFDPE